MVNQLKNVEFLFEMFDFISLVFNNFLVWHFRSNIFGLILLRLKKLDPVYLLDLKIAKKYIKSQQIKKINPFWWIKLFLPEFYTLYF